MNNNGHRIKRLTMRVCVVFLSSIFIHVHIYVRIPFCLRSMPTTHQDGLASTFSVAQPNSNSISSVKSVLSNQYSLTTHSSI